MHEACIPTKNAMFSRRVDSLKKSGVISGEIDEDSTGIAETLLPLFAIFLSQTDNFTHYFYPIEEMREFQSFLDNYKENVSLWRRQVYESAYLNVLKYQQLISPIERERFLKDVCTVALSPEELAQWGQLVKFSDLKGRDYQGTVLLPKDGLYLDMFSNVIPPKIQLALIDLNVAVASLMMIWFGPERVIEKKVVRKGEQRVQQIFSPLPWGGITPEVDIDQEHTAILRAAGRNSIEVVAASVLTDHGSEDDGRDNGVQMSRVSSRVGKQGNASALQYLMQLLYSDRLRFLHCRYDQDENGSPGPSDRRQVYKGHFSETAEPPFGYSGMENTRMESEGLTYEVVRLAKKNPLLNIG